MYTLTEAGKDRSRINFDWAIDTVDAIERAIIVSAPGNVVRDPRLNDFKGDATVWELVHGANGVTV